MSSNEPVSKYYSNGRVIHSRYSDGYEYCYEYDSNGSVIHFKDSTGLEKWWEYDSNGNHIYTKNNEGEEIWYWEGEPTEDPVKILLLVTQLYSKAS